MRSAPLFPLTPILLIHSMPIVTRRDRRRAVLLFNSSPVVRREEVLRREGAKGEREWHMEQGRLGGPLCKDFFRRKLRRLDAAVF